MKIVLYQTVHLKTFNKGSTVLTKFFESNTIPHKGDFIEDSIWKAGDDQEVQSVVINYQKNVCYVNLSPVTLNTEDKVKLTEYENMAKLHEWLPIR
ncbi:hypothetical protein [Exiguobacterium sp. s133]|uniref:hypothetical protein n=1 Tax=Exiguobacterium sp. s133 TaxID=2751213 RepID=UPI001BE7820E|nr:hypothetical protein [Exiguobacterium sp. s133]